MLASLLLLGSLIFDLQKVCLEKGKEKEKSRICFMSDPYRLVAHALDHDGTAIDDHIVVDVVA